MMPEMIADLVLLNGVVYTANSCRAVHQAIAVKDERIAFVGSSDEARSYIGSQTAVIDLAGKLVIPGLLDTHIHPPGLSLLELYEVGLFHANSISGYVETVRDFIAQHPDAPMVYGRGWSWDVLEGDERNAGPRKEYLDAISSDIPVILRASDGHTLWVNSKALAVNGITADTVAPHGGVITKDIDGTLWGTLKETAMWLVALPEYSLEQYMKAMLVFQEKMHSFGITGILCLSRLSLDMLFQTYDEMQKQQTLKLRVRGAVSFNPQEDLSAQFEAFNALCQRHESPLLKIITVKFLTDGVIEGGTAHLLEPYAAKAGKGDCYHGDFLWDMAKLEQAFYQTNASGFSVHVHSIGDASTKKVLDVLAKVNRKLPDQNCRNVITHLQLVDEADILRFKELQVIASVQPYWHYKGPNWWYNVDYQLLGERAEREFPLASFFQHGVVVASSSDYSATLVPNPLLAIKTGVTRNLASGKLYGVDDITDIDDERYLLNKAERASVPQMLDSFTINGAYLMSMENEIGSLEVGKYADMAVLDRHILELNPLDIDQAQVVMTFFAGRLVYESKQADQ